MSAFRASGGSVSSGVTITLPTIINHIAVFIDNGGTLSKDTVLCISSGSIQAGLSGTSGTLVSYPSGLNTGFLVIGATANVSNVTTTITNASMAQSSILTFPDPVSSGATFLMSNTLTQQTLSTLLLTNCSATTLQITTSTLGSLTPSTAYITSSVLTNSTIASLLVTNLNSTTGTISSISVTSGTIGSLIGTNIFITSGTLGSYTATNVSVTNLTVTSGTVTSLLSTNEIATSGTIGTLTGTTYTGTSSTVGTLAADNMTFTNTGSGYGSTLYFTTGSLSNVGSGYLTINLQTQSGISFPSVSSDTITINKSGIYIIYIEFTPINATNPICYVEINGTQRETVNNNNNTSATIVMSMSDIYTLVSGNTIKIFINIGTSSSNGSARGYIARVG